MDAESLKQTFLHHYLHLKGPPEPSFSIQFFSYAGLRNTIRVRQGRVIVRLSDILCDAPAEVLAAILVILLHKLFRRPAPVEDRRRYRQYVDRPEIRRLTERVRRLRGRKHLTSPCGKVYDLRRLFDDLNQRFFKGTVKVRNLSWSRRKNRSVLGHYDRAHSTIVIDRRLDHPQVPRCVLEYVLYHEMLHTVFEEEKHNGRRRVHHRRFQRREREFPQYHQARDFIRLHLTSGRGIRRAVVD